MNCESNQAHFDFPTCYQGGSLESFDFEIAEENGAALSSATIAFKLAGSDTASLTLTGGDGLTLTTTAGAWVVGVDQIDAIALTPGVYHYTLKTVDANSLAKHYVGGTWNIIDV